MLGLARIHCLGDAIRDATVKYKSNVALIEADRHRENGRWTFAELSAQARRFSGALQQQGFAAGDRCAIVMQNQAKWIVSATGAFWAGAVLVPIDYKLTAPEQLALLGHSRAKILVTEWPTYLAMRTAKGADVLEKVAVFVTEAPTDADVGRAPRWESAPADEAQYRARQREDLACIVYSSGTAGTPKGCMLTHANYLEQAESLAGLYPIEEVDRYFSILPTNHAIDFMCGFLLPLLFGAAIVHQRTLRPQYLRATMKEYGITHMALVPTVLKTLERRIRERLDELPTWQRMILDGLVRVNEMATARGPRLGLSQTLLRSIHQEFGGKLKLLFCGGAFVDRSSAEFFYGLGIPVVIGYGLTEAVTVLTVNDLKPFRGDTVGRVVPGVELEVRQADAHGVGEIWVRGSTIMAGYLDAPELTAESIVDGWLRTGDVGWLDAAGHLRLVGRVKNMIVTEGGKNVYPEDIEAAFEGLADCEEFCVFASNYVWSTGKLTGEELMVVIRPEGEAPSEALLADLRARNLKLPDFKRLSSYVVWSDEFPRTASLKIKRNDLRDRLVAKHDRAAATRSL